MGMYRSMSSAYPVRLQSMGKFTLVTSSMYTRKSNGPSTEPCGTLEITGRTPDDPPCMMTCSLFVRYEHNHAVEDLGPVNAV